MRLFDDPADADVSDAGWYLERQDVVESVRARVRLDGRPSNVLVFHGPGGIGKTVSRQMVQRLVFDQMKVPYVVIDFEPDDGSLRSREHTFAFIRRLLGRQGIHFTSFDLIWARYWEETTNQRIRADKYPPELDDLADIASLIPILGSIPAAIKALLDLSESGRQWLNERFGKASGQGSIRDLDAELLRNCSLERWHKTLSVGVMHSALRRGQMR